MEIPLPLILTGLGLLGAAATWVVSQPARIIRDVREQLDRELKDRQSAQGRCRELEVALAACKTERAHFSETAGRLSRGAARLTDPDALDDALDHARCGIVVSNADGGGRWDWVSASVVDNLGHESRSEVLRLNWRRLIHPHDLRRTLAVEGSAWGGPVKGHSNRYQRVDGSYSQWRWWCSAYRNGIAVCVVWFEDPAEGEKSD